LATSVNALTGATSTTTSTSTGAAGATPSKELFLQLLVAQIKNQDPLSPTDSMQFVSQLAQFSELEQIIAIRQGVDNLSTAAGETTATSTQSTSAT
jgi:flagellar basal-body rod modification protein FlgD